MRSTRRNSTIGGRAMTASEAMAHAVQEGRVRGAREVPLPESSSDEDSDGGGGGGAAAAAAPPSTAGAGSGSDSGGDGEESDGSDASYLNSLQPDLPYEASGAESGSEAPSRTATATWARPATCPPRSSASSSSRNTRSPARSARWR
jgi:hypothetical protein